MAPNLKLANAISGPILVVKLLVLGRYLRQRNQRRLGAIAKRRATSLPEAEIDADAQRGQAYLQWKAELDNEGSRLYEVVAKGKSHEVGADGQRYELTGSEGIKSLGKKSIRKSWKYLNDDIL